MKCETLCWQKPAHSITATDEHYNSKHFVTLMQSNRRVLLRWLVFPRLAIAYNSTFAAQSTLAMSAEIARVVLCSLIASVSMILKATATQQQHTHQLLLYFVIHGVSDSRDHMFVYHYSTSCKATSSRECCHRACQMANGTTLIDVVQPEHTACSGTSTAQIDRKLCCNVLL
jgi:hypothetical protein